MVLDLFGNLLGKSSKKNSNSQQQQQANGGGGGQTDNDSTSTDNDSYVFVNHNNSSLYTQTTILTDEMIRTMGSSSSVATTSSSSGGGFQQPQGGGPSSMVYPSLDVTNGYHNPHLPFSTVPMPSPMHGNPNSSHLSAPNNQFHSRTASPIDNVPFVLSNYSAANGAGGAGGYDEDYELGETISRVQQFLANPNISEYNFKLENGLLTATY